MPCTEYGNAHMHIAPHIDFPFELTFAAFFPFVDRLSFHYNINCRQNMPDTLFNGTKMTEQKNYTLEAAGKNIVHKKQKQIEKEATTWPSNINETVSDMKIAIFVVWPCRALLRSSHIWPSFTCVFVLFRFTILFYSILLLIVFSYFPVIFLYDAFEIALFCFDDDADVT